MLEFAESNDIALISKITILIYFQLLNWTRLMSFNRSLYGSESKWLRNRSSKLKRFQFEELFSRRCGKSAKPENVISIFKATGTYPLNHGTIPSYAFLNSKTTHQPVEVRGFRNPDGQKPVNGNIKSESKPCSKRSNLYSYKTIE